LEIDFGKTEWDPKQSKLWLYSNFLESLENELQDQLATTLYQEEYLLHQKSRGKWIANGDCNTEYYHSKTIVRRRRNKFVSLRNEASGRRFDL
jgi:hypothetical protein